MPQFCLFTLYSTHFLYTFSDFHKYEKNLSRIFFYIFALKKMAKKNDETKIFLIELGGNISNINYVGA